MNTPFVKVTLLAAVIALGSFLSPSAQAALVRTSGGAPVLSAGGNCVVSNWEGSDQCEAAKSAAGISATTDRAHEAVVAPNCPPEMHEHDHAVYFDFNKATLSADAKQKLDHIAKKLAWVDKKHPHAAHGMNVTVVGFADRLGSAKGNQALAAKRAKAVSTYLTAKGVKVNKVEVHAVDDASKAKCPATLPRKKLIDCLREDRRVEIEISHAAK
jgi:outer membrane protein OmpA-like peptidoglycan-associated protein